MNAMVANKRFDKQNRTPRKKNVLPVKDNTNTTKIKCYRCKKISHKGSECRKTREKNEQSAQSAKHHLFHGVPETQAYKNNKYSRQLTQAAYANQDTIWCLDSGCSSHLSKNIDDLNDTCSVESGKLHLANNASTDIKTRGNVQIQVSLGRKTKRVELTDALHVPDLRTNLMSVGKITDKGYRVIFEKDSAEIINDYGETILTANRIDGLYYIKAERTNARIANLYTKKQESSNLELSSLWHRRMGT